MADKTHWKKVVSDPNFLGEADFQENEEKVVTIARVAEEVAVQTNRGKEKKAAVYFRENLKPMILNATRSKAITKVAGSPYFEDWVGVQIQLYIDPNVEAFGEIVSAVRVRPSKPKIKNIILCEDCGQEIQGANGRSADYIAAYTKKKFDACLCFSCATARTEKTEPEQGGEVDGQTEIDG